MQALRFGSAVDNILERDKRFDDGAYFFLKEALDFTLKRIGEEILNLMERQKASLVKKNRFMDSVQNHRL